MLLLGRQELLRWVTEPSAPMDLRDEFMVYLCADAAIGPLGLEAELQRRITLHEDKWQTYREIEQRDFPPGLPLSREARIHHMILKKGILYEEGSVQWSRQMLELLRML